MKHGFSSISLVPVLLLSVGFAGCSSESDDNRSAASNEDYDDVAQSLGAVVVSSNNSGEVAALSDSTDLAVGIAPLGISVNASGGFTGERVGLSYDFMLACSDASGAQLDKCGMSTDRASVNVDWSGNLSLPNFVAAVERHGDWSLTGIQSGTATFSGTGTLQASAKFQSLSRNIEREYNLSYSAEYDAVQVRRLPRLIVGGSVHYAIVAERKASSNRGESQTKFQVDAVLKFGEDGGATLTLDGSHHYLVNALGQVARQ